MALKTKNRREHSEKHGVRLSVRHKKQPSRSSLHGNAVAVSVNERLEGLQQRYPALQSSLNPLLLEGCKRIRDLPPFEQWRILRMVFALKQASGT